MKKALSIVLAFQVLLSSLSFNIGMHFCGESLRSLSLFSKATPCEHAQVSNKNRACPFHSNKKDKKKGCCDDEQLIINGTEHLATLDSPTKAISQTVDFTPPTPYYLNQSAVTERHRSAKFRNYKPPLIHVDTPVLIQTFLI